MTVHYTDDSVTLHHGNCLDVLRTLPDASVDAVVTDPPYNLSFMGKAWDDHATAVGFQAWCEAWSAECLRVLKPGGHLLAFGGTRTWHRLACAVEDAGFEVRDSIAWLYGSGFPKSLNVGKAIQSGGGRPEDIRRMAMGDDYAPSGRGRVNYDHGGGSAMNGATANVPLSPDAQKWAGWGTALKPAFEPVVVARKPLGSTVAANVLQWGCGAINIDATRVQADFGSREGSSGEARTRGCAVHGLPGLREADAQGPVRSGASQDARDVLAVVPQQADDPGAESPLGRGRVDRGSIGVPGRVGGTPVAGGPGATANTAAAGVPGTQAGHGAEDRSPAALGRDGASHQRREGGQPPGESAPDRLGGSLAGAPTDRAGTGGAASGERPTSGCTCATDTVAAGRWPANVVLDDTQAAELDRQSGTTTSAAGAVTYSQQKSRRGASATVDADNDKGRREVVAQGFGDSGGASRFFPTFRYEAKAPTAERPRVKVDGAGDARTTFTGKVCACLTCEKRYPSPADMTCGHTEYEYRPLLDRPHGEGYVSHPTVKPLDLMRWLVRLVTPPGGVVLEPFAGSGTTAEACVLEGFRCIAIEREADYLPLIVQRLSKPLQVGLFGEEIA